MATSSTTASTPNAVLALGAGSGIDVKALARSLAEADVAAQKGRLNASAGRTEARISGLGALKYTLAQLKAAFEKLNDASDFGAPQVANTQPAAVGVTAASTARTGSYTLEVTRLARPQRSVSTGFAEANTPLNGGQPMSLSLSVNGAAALSISVATDTPEGMVTAINRADLGVTAQLVRTGEGAAPFAIVLTGQTGAARGFVMGSSVPGVHFDEQLSDAADAAFKLNGLPITRSGNTVSDLVTDVTLQLNGLTAGPARVDLVRDTQAAKDGIKGLVSAYNEFEESLKILGDSKSEVEELGGSLAGNSLLRDIRNQVRNLLVATSSTPGSSIKAARDVGLSLDRNGRLTLDEARLDKALQSSLAEVSQMFSAGTNNKSLFSTQPAGLAGDAVVQIDRLLRSTGMVASQTDAATRELARTKTRLKELDARMQKLLERYTSQFSLMESVVGKTNSLKGSLSSSFEAMMASYTR